MDAEIRAAICRIELMQDGASIARGTGTLVADGRLVAALPGGDEVLVADKFGAVHRAAAKGGVERGERVQLSSQQLTAIASDRDGRWLAADALGLLSLYDSSGALQIQFHHPNSPAAVALSSDGQWAASASRDFFGMPPEPSVLPSNAEPQANNETIRIWRADWRGALAAACERLSAHQDFQRGSAMGGAAADIVRQARAACRMVKQ